MAFWTYVKHCISGNLLQKRKSRPDIDGGYDVIYRPGGQNRRVQVDLGC